MVEAVNDILKEQSNCRYNRWWLCIALSQRGRLKTLTELHLIARKEDPKHVIGCFIIFLIWNRITWAMRTSLPQFGENLSLWMETLYEVRLLQYIIITGKWSMTYWKMNWTEAFYYPLVPLTFPLWFQSGGSSCPWGSRPVSKHVRNCSKWPPLGKCRGGLWIPSWLTKTTVPPLFTGDMQTMGTR